MTQWTIKLPISNPSGGDVLNGVFAGALALISVLGLAGCVNASEPAASLRAGQLYAVRVCAQCHDVTIRHAQPFATPGAPDFYAIANAKTTSIVGLNAFLTTPHPTMPNLIIPDEDRRNVIAYIFSLRAEKRDTPSI